MTITGIMSNEWLTFKGGYDRTGKAGIGNTFGPPLDRIWDAKETNGTSLFGVGAKTGVSFREMVRGGKDIAFGFMRRNMPFYGGGTGSMTITTRILYRSGWTS